MVLSFRGALSNLCLPALSLLFFFRVSSLGHLLDLDISMAPVLEPAAWSCDVQDCLTPLRTEVGV